MAGRSDQQRAPVVGAWYYFDTQEQLSRLETAENREQDLRRTLTNKQKKAANLDAYKQQLAEMQESFGAMLRQLPDKTEVGVSDDVIIAPDLHERIDAATAERIGLVEEVVGTGESLDKAMALAEQVDKLQAICVICGNAASRTQRLIDERPARYDDPVILVGGSESYEARCRQCHEVPGKPEPSNFG